MNSKRKALAIANAASDKKARDIIVIDIRKAPSVADYFVITSGNSTTQVKAIADNIAKKLKDEKEKLWHIEGAREALWVLLDFGDVVAHIFYDETRRFYDLERLWGSFKKVPYGEVKPKLKHKKVYAVKKKRGARKAPRNKKRS